MSLIVKLLALVAVLLLPLAMQPLVASPVASHGKAATMNMPVEHCPEQRPSHHSKGTFAECTMACSAALPAADRIADSPLVVICVPVSAGLAPLLHGLHPETATPPPRRS